VNYRTAPAVLLALAALTTGCQPAKPAKPTADIAQPLAVPNPAAAVPPAAAVQPAGDPARAAADDFLRLVTADPPAAAAKLTPGFKALFFSGDKATDWLREQGQGLTAVTVRSQHAAPGGAEVSLRGDAQRGPQKVSFALRLTRDANTTWSVSRVLVADVTTAAPANAGPPEAAWARESALDFLEAFLSAAPHDDFSFALAGLTDPFKAELGSSDNARRQWLRPRRQGLTGYVLPGPGSMTGDTAVFAGDLTGPQRKALFALTLGRTADGRWLVRGFAVTE
jgi:hypothetical protein